MDSIPRIKTSSDIDALIGETENQFLEFKEQISDPTKIVDEIIGFANTGGGTVVIGIKDEGNKANAKMPIDNMREKQPIADYIQQMISSHSKPPVPCEILPIDAEEVGKCFLVITVEKQGKRYFNSKNRVLVRRGTITEEAKSEEIMEMFFVDNVPSADNKTDFLRKRHLFESDDPNFGKTVWGERMNKVIKDTEENSIDLPWLIISFIPELLDDSKVDTGNREVVDKIINLSKDCFFDQRGGQLLGGYFQETAYDTESVTFVSVLGQDHYDSTPLHERHPLFYTEITNHGYIEAGICYEIFRLHNGIRMCVSMLAAYLDAYIRFTCRLYREFKISESAEVRLSLVNMKGTTLLCPADGWEYLWDDPLHDIKKYAFQSLNALLKYEVAMNNASQEEEIRKAVESIGDRFLRGFNMTNRVYCTKEDDKIDQHALDDCKVWRRG